MSDLHILAISLSVMILVSTAVAAATPSWAILLNNMVTLVKGHGWAFNEI